MATIPASQIVNFLPGVISAGGNALVLNGVALTTSYRVPTGTVQSFGSYAAVGAWFGLASTEYAWAQLYFNGYLNASQQPASLLFAQYTPAGVGGWLKSGPVSSLTISQIQAISGTLTVTMDGYARTAGSLNLSSATSYSAAASAIATALNGSLSTVVSSATSTIAAGTASVTAYISGNVMTVTVVGSGTVYAGSAASGTGVTSGTTITGQLTGTAGGVGTYSVNKYQNVASGTISLTYGTLTASAPSSGTWSVGQTVSGGTTSAGTIVTALGTGTGGAGTYIVNNTQTVTSATLTGAPTPVTVAYDSQSGSFFITSGVVGANATSAYATGTTAASLFLTAATGATLSQGAAPQTPGAFMANLIQVTQNWATFFTIQDPDGGSTNGPGQKLLFSAWTSAQLNRYGYLAWDTDPAPTLSSSATTSLGYQIANTYNYTGTCVIYDPTGQGIAAFTAGCIASINFGAINGRTTLAFRQQSGIVAAATNLTVAQNLQANGYNYYGAWATANQPFQFLYPGSVSGPFLWLDSYVNQIYMNAALQLDLMELLVTLPSVPYNAAGYAMVENACLTTIQQMLTFGAIRTGVVLSSLETLYINNQTGQNVAPTVQNQGWYFQVQPASPQVRAARTTPVCLFFYTDGQSIQQITLSSLEVQ